MDPERRSLIVTAAVGLLVLAIIIGSIYYLVRFIQNRQSGQSTQVSNEQQSQTPEGTASATFNPTASTAPQGTSSTSNPKIYNGGNFQIAYPQNWGVLTCSNSKNVELDPTNSANSEVACDFAQKPVTVLATDNLNCQGEFVNLGGNQVVRSSQGNKGGGEVSYRWCIVNPNGIDLDITHRVSQNGSRATSKQDFSQDIEQMISRIRFSQGS